MMRVAGVEEGGQDRRVQDNGHVSSPVDHFINLIHRPVAQVFRLGFPSLDLFRGKRFPPGLRQEAGPMSGGKINHLAEYVGLGGLGSGSHCEVVAKLLQLGLVLVADSNWRCDHTMMYTL